MQFQCQIAKSLLDKVLECPKIRASWPRGTNRPGLRSRNCKQRWKTMREKIKAETLNEEELDLDIRALQAGEGRRGSDASQQNGCCLDSAILQQFVAMRVEQQFAIFSASSTRYLRCSTRQSRRRGKEGQAVNSKRRQFNNQGKILVATRRRVAVDGRRGALAQI